MKTNHHSYLKGLAVAVCAAAPFVLNSCMMESRPALEPGSHAEKLYTRAVAGDAIAQYELGVCYSDGGNGVGPRNEAEAAKWILKSAKEGYTEAQHSIAIYYEYGKSAAGIKKDPKEAVRWYRAAAQGGNVEAQYSLGKCYEEGYGGLPKDMAEAFLWYRRSALERYDLSMLALAECYDYGKGCTPSREDAILWYREVAKLDELNLSPRAKSRLKELGVR